MRAPTNVGSMMAAARCTGAHTNVEVKTGGGLDMVKFGLAYQLGQ